VVFCFSKKKCEDICDHFTSQDMLTAAQKGQVRMAFDGVRSRLSAADSRLPQVLRVEERARRGVGVHHGGLLPILKEVVEVLFSQGLVKVRTCGWGGGGRGYWCIFLSILSPFSAFP
jgi:antiviral helicase SKI2